MTISPTIHSKITQGSRSRPLNLNIRALEQEEDGLQGGSINRSHIYTSTVSSSTVAIPNTLTLHTSLRNLRKRQTRTPLQINILAIHQRAQRLQRLAREEVGLSSLYTYALVSKPTSNLALTPVPRMSSNSLNSHSPNNSTDQPRPPSPHRPAHSHSRPCSSARHSTSTASATAHSSSALSLPKK